MTAARDLLIISPNFPPLGNPRSIQVGRMVKALAAAGLSIDVIALGDAARLPENSHGDCPPVVNPAVEVLAFAPSRARSIALATRLYRMLRPADVYRYYGALRSAVRNALHTHCYRHVLSIAEPLVSHQVALDVQRLAPNIPFSFFFSDPVPTPADAEMMKLRVRRSCVHRLARRCARIGKLCIAPTREILDRIGSLGSAERMVLPHAFDPEDWKAIRPAAADQGGRSITVLHAGALYYRRRPDILLDAVAALRAGSGGDVRIRLVGYADAETRRTASSARYEEFVSVEPGVPFEQARQAMLEADILCVVDCSLERNVHLPSKTADYVAARKPILYIGQPAAPTARLLRQIHPAFRQAAAPAEAVAGLRELIARTRTLPRSAFDECCEKLRMENVYAPLIRQFTS